MAKRKRYLTVPTAVLVLASLLLADPSDAAAQVVCGERARILARLAARYDEAPSAIGVTAAGQVIEVLTSASGSWTIVVTAPEGPACVVASGEGWRRVEPEKKGRAL